ncbi:WD40 repeat-like protein, partial [Auricularia subglabra TFB-10046 SS5]
MVSSVAFSPDGTWFVSGSHDCSVRLWAPVESTTGAICTLQRTCLGHAGEVHSVAWDPTSGSGRFASGALDNTVRVWNAATGDTCHTLRGHSRGIHSVAFSADGKRLASGADDGTAIIWDVSSGQQMLALLGHTSAIWSIAFSPDDRSVVSGSQDSTVRVWDAATGEERDRFPVLPDARPTVAFSPDGAKIACACGNLQLWDA